MGGEYKKKLSKMYPKNLYKTPHTNPPWRGRAGAIWEVFWCPFLRLFRGFLSSLKPFHLIVQPC